ncbi:MAG: 6-pyruvoyl-tetrahydropterin synthase-related protein [Candidatus Brocadiaceae bacterium]|nr:6-pyruvoyl-tetrahydropterin synthase-related protein [Candidatus Brocadiaceae bacterium]
MRYQKKQKTVTVPVALRRRYLICDSVILILLEVCILSFCHPLLLIRDSTITGGDTASYFHVANYLKETLLPSGRLIGWDLGNFAGYPLFQFYFIMPFLLAVVLGYFVKLTVALKMVSILGLLTLPLFTYLSFRKLKYDFPVPVIAAICTLVFLFQEGFDMWGGNFLSTLAGEFCYGISLSVFVLYLGFLYQGVQENKGLIGNVFLLALCGFCHSFVFAVAVMLPLFFLLCGMGGQLPFRNNFLLRKKQNGKDVCGDPSEERVFFAKKLHYIMKLYLLSFLLMGFWIIPFFAKLSYTTPFYLIWLFSSWRELFPCSLIPFFVFSILRVVLPGRYFERSDKGKCRYFLYLCLVALLLYFNAHLHSAPDIRFLPVVYLATIFIAADFVHCMVPYLRPKILFAGMILYGTLFWVYSHESNVGYWAEWNYEGYEAKESWPTFEKITAFLKGDISDPRVAYEKSSVYDAFGSDRVFESLPFFSGRQTLEGIHFASSLSAKPIMFLQTEFSKEVLAPMYFIFSKINIDTACKHFNMYNISQVIVVSDNIKSLLREHEQFQEVFRLEEYSIFKFTGNTGNYVEIPKYLPVIYTGRNWREGFYEWFKIPETIDVPVIPAGYVSTEDLKHFPSSSNSVYNIQRFKNDNFLSLIDRVTPVKITETVTPFQIRFVTPHTGVPHIVKVSYFPNWKVSGADKVYPVSPGFMLVIPNQHEVVLTYGRVPADIIGSIATFAGVVICILTMCGTWKRKGSAVRSLFFSMYAVVFQLRPYIFIVAIVLLGVSTTYSIIYRNYPVKIQEKGIDLFNREEYERAIDTFQKLTKGEKHDSFDFALALLFEARSQVLLKRYDAGIKTFQYLVDMLPYSRYVAEAYYEIGQTYLLVNDVERAGESFQKAIDADRYSPYTPHARDSLEQLHDGHFHEAAYQEGIELFNKKNYVEALEAFRKITATDDFNVPEYVSSLLFEARCNTFTGNPDEGIEIFQKVISLYGDSMYVPECYYEIGLIYAGRGERAQAKEMFQKAINTEKDSPYVKHSMDRLSELGQGL